MIIGTVGRLGKGKTASGLLWLYTCYCLGWKIYSNIWLAFPHIPITSPLDFINMEEGASLLDELWALADNRRSSSSLNRLVTILCLRSRKKKFHIFYTQQFLQIDIRIMYITDYWIRPKIIPDPLTGLPPVFLEQKIYNGDWEELPSRRYDVRPYLDLYDTEQDPYTLSPLMSDTAMRSAINKAYENDSSLEPEIVEIEEKAKEKEKKRRELKIVL